MIANNKNRIFAGLAALAGLAGSMAAGAQTSTSLLDPLHGYCGGAGQCIDNGTNSPTSNNPPVNWGFTISPGPATGDFIVEILTPNNDGQLGAYPITGTLTGTANNFSATPWTSGFLDAYLGISASPANGIGAYLPSTQALDPTATGFFVDQVDFGTTTLLDASMPNISPLENSGALPLGSYIVGFLNLGTAQNPDWIATANSGAIFETGPHQPNLPEPGTLALAGLAIVGLGLARRRRVGAPS